MREITDRFIRRLKPGAATRIYYERAVRGFGVRITPAGSIAFVLNYRFHGKERRITLGGFPECSTATARDRARECRHEIRAGLDPFAERERRERESLEAEARSKTLKDLADCYIERHAVPHKRPASVRDDRSMLSGVILPRLGQFRLRSVGRRDVEDLHQELKGTPYRANRVLALLSKMFNFAIADERGSWGLVSNPAKGIAKFHEEPRQRWLSEKEIARLSRALSKAHNQEIADAIRLIMLTGARKSEALRARCEDFDLSRGVWTKPSHHTKQNKTEHVPLSPEAVQLLRRLTRGKSGPVFPGRTDGEPLSEIKQAWADISTAAGLKGVRIHDLRHTFASHLVSRGIPLQVVGQLLGHTQAHTTERYAHLADGALRDATNLYGRIVRQRPKAGRKR